MRAPVAILLLACALAARAAAPVYEVMSLVGDGLLIVEHRSSTGTSLAGNAREFVPLQVTILDSTVLLAVDTAIRGIDPAAKPFLLAGHDPALLEAQSRMLEGGGTLQQVVDLLRPRLPRTGATRLVLVVKARHATTIRMADGDHVGSGSLEGLGFYLDPALPTARSDNGLADFGLLAPFAYFTIALVDLGTGRIVAQRSVYSSTSVSAARSDTLSAWDAMSNTDKIRTVRSLLDGEVRQAVPKLLDAPG